MAAAELNVAQSLRDHIGSKSERIEQDCRVPYELIQDLRKHGLFSMMIPRAYGGTERTPQDIVAVIEELAFSDSAVGWSAMIYSTTAMLSGFLPPEWGAEIFGADSKAGEHCAIAAGAAAPSGRAVVVNDGIVVSGRWQWGSGTHNSDWIVGGTLVSDDGDLVRDVSGAPALHVVFFHRSEVQLIDNWNPAGLRGTGSVDFSVEECFVPDGRWVVLGQTPPTINSPSYQFPFYGFFAAAVASVPLGIARRALYDFEKSHQSKTKENRKRKASTPPMTQLEFGKAEALIHAARYTLFGSLNEVWDDLLATPPLTETHRRTLRLAASQSTKMSVEAVERLFNASGGGALRDGNPIQDHLRNIHAAKQHRMVSPEFFRMAAGVHLDDEPSVQL
ncbi:MAG: acyl-CoA dehydrogenase family protein [Pseudomonadota bacterium]